MEYRHTVLLDDVTPSADGTRDDELPINPISHLIFTIKCLNASAKATLAQMLGALENISIVDGGRTMISLSAADLFALNVLFLGFEPIQENVVDTDNATRAVSLILPMGRKIFNPKECYPSSRRGELYLHTQFDIADTGYDGLILQVETVELPEATPERHLTYTTLTYTPSATGEADVDLPIGLPYLGVLLFSTTVPTGTAWTTTANKVTFLVDNFERYIRATNWESLHGQSVMRGAPVNQWAEKFHTENTGASYAQNADTATEEPDDSDISAYSLIDFDPHKDGMFTFDSNGVSDLALRIDAGDTNAIRIVPLQTRPASRRQS